ncbi:MAG: bifunctional methylenetetrahydrofolate dehydrogenase/methenyltetrahydrofolate cyclohydrolase FolD [Mangrovicoccus sp.]
MTAQIIDGKSFAAELRGEIAQHVARLKEEHGLTPGLAVVLVGEDPASQVYVRSKEKQTVECGMKSFAHRLPATTSQDSLEALIDQLNADPEVHGILVQFPLPNGLDEQRVIDRISLAKDVDGFHPENVGRLIAGLPALAPCTPLGCLMLLRHHLGDLTGKHAVVIGRSHTVGKPMGALLLNDSCTVSITHSRTQDLPGLVAQADIVVAAVGRAEMVKGAWLKPGATVIDVGINRVAQEGAKDKLIGDVEFAAAKDVAGAITPVPGGVGPMTIACLLSNTLVAACRAQGVEAPKGLTA